MNEFVCVAAVAAGAVVASTASAELVGIVGGGAVGPDEGFGPGSAVHVEAHLFDLAHQGVVAALIDLAAHEDGREFNDWFVVGLEDKTRWW